MHTLQVEQTPKIKYVTYKPVRQKTSPSNTTGNRISCRLFIKQFDLL